MLTRVAVRGAPFPDMLTLMLACQHQRTSMRRGILLEGLTAVHSYTKDRPCRLDPQYTGSYSDQNSDNHLMLDSNQESRRVHDNPQHYSITHLSPKPGDGGVPMNLLHLYRDYLLQMMESDR